MGNHKDFSDEDLKAADAFIERLKALPRNRVSVLNMKRVEQMKFSYLAIQKALRDSHCDAKVTCRQSELAPDVGAIDVDGVTIEIANGEWFARAAEFADNTDVYPLKGDKIRMVFGFNHFTTPI